MHRGQIGEVGAAFERGHRQAADRVLASICGSASVMLAKAKSTSPADHRRRRGRAALEGNVHRLGAGADLEQLDRIVRQAADAAGAVVELVRDWPWRRRRAPAIDFTGRSFLTTTACTIVLTMPTGARSLHRIVSDLLGERRDRDGADAAHAEGVAVRRRARDRLRPDDAAGARPAFDDHRFAQRLLDVTRGQPADQVGVTARGVGHDEGDRPARPRVLSLQPRPGAQRQPQRQRQLRNRASSVSPLGSRSPRSKFLAVARIYGTAIPWQAPPRRTRGRCNQWAGTLQPLRVGTWGGSSRRAGLGNPAESNSETPPRGAC